MSHLKPYTEPSRIQTHCWVMLNGEEVCLDIDAEVSPRETFNHENTATIYLMMNGSDEVTESDLDESEMDKVYQAVFEAE